MGAGEIIERFGFDDDEAVKIDRYAEWAWAAVRQAADWRLAARSHAAGGDDERVAHTIGYAAMRMEEARTWGHEIRAMIADALRIEARLSKTATLARAWRFVESACGDESCKDCDRPIWQHVQSKLHERLCPFGRRYWRIARALCPEIDEPGPSNDRDFLRLLASRV